MKKIILVAMALLMAVSTLSFASTLQSLNKNQVTTTFSGNTITTAPIITMDKQLVNNTATLYFDKQGTLTGQMNMKPDNGPQTDQGTWMVKPTGALCVTWQHWNQAQPICVSAFKVMNGVVLVNASNQNFETMIPKNNIKSGNQMNQM